MYLMNDWLIDWLIDYKHILSIGNIDLFWQDYLLKQGLTVQKAECLLWNVIKNTNSLQFDIDLAQNHFMEQVQFKASD